MPPPKAASAPDEAGAILIPGGEYDLGRLEHNPLPRSVAVKPMYVSQQLVTTLEFTDFLNSGVIDERSAFYLGITPDIRKDEISNKFEPESEASGAFPARNVTWMGAMAYCAWLSNEEEIYRLPTELEWEYLASNGGRSRYPWGNTENIPGRTESSRSINGVFLMHLPVCSLPKNANTWGIMDLIGTVPQWCFDYYVETGIRNRTWLRNAEAICDDRSVAEMHNKTTPLRVLKGGIALPGGNFWFRESVFPTAEGRSAYAESNALHVSRNPTGFRWVREHRKQKTLEEAGKPESR